jgi:hypothetical protein
MGEAKSPLGVIFFARGWCYSFKNCFLAVDALEGKQS